MPEIQKIGSFEANVSRKLGDGGFGEVFRAKDQSEDPPVECAAKKIPLKSKSDVEVVEHEVDVLKAVSGHPAVIGLRGFHKDERFAWLFMELATGGELFDRLIDSGNLSEKACWPYAKALVEGVLHCHNHGVIHRDIKLENIMLSAEDPGAIKLIDFGLAAQMKAGADGKPVFEKLYESVGTKSYRAPEINDKSGYMGPPVDTWSMGIVLFSLASGFFPLEEAKQSDWRYAKLAADQKRGIGACESIYSMYKRKCPFSTNLREMLDGMLTIDTTKRPSLVELSSCAYLQPPVRAASNSGEYDNYDDPVVYRSAMAMDEDEPCEPFEPPPEAMRISRQMACRDF
mmetsp:Transcript_68852/g.153664  ORF Transcript_68852/g.153664 Transcript_68852/m.153664 type:complete len:343 (-) Transcript_68852:448-1476(-)